MKARTVSKWLGIVTLLAITGLSLCVKYDLLPFPNVEVVEIRSHFINGEFHERTVPNEAIVEEQGKKYIYVIQSHTNYWLDGLYAVKTEIRLVAQDEAMSSINLVDNDAHPKGVHQVVLEPSLSFSDRQKIYIEN